MSLLINASIKKSGTTFVHNLFAENAGKVSNLVVPPIKEWYFFPNYTKDSLNYRSLSKRAGDALAELAVPISGSDANRFQLYDLLFAEKLIAEAPVREKLMALSRRHDPEYAHLAMGRALNLIDTYPYGSTFFLSDPNFLNDFNFVMDGEQQKEVAAGLGRKEAVYFSVVRKPHKAALSLLKERQAGEVAPVTDESHYKRAFERQVVFPQLKTMFRSGLCKNILLVDMDYLTKSTKEAFGKICNFAGLESNDAITVPENPNPSREFPAEALHKAEKTFESMFDASPLKKMYQFVEEHQCVLLSLDGSDFKLNSVAL